MYSEVDLERIRIRTVITPHEGGVFANCRMFDDVSVAA